MNHSNFAALHYWKSRTIDCPRYGTFSLTIGLARSRGILRRMPHVDEGREGARRPRAERGRRRLQMRRVSHHSRSIGDGPSKVKSAVCKQNKVHVFSSKARRRVIAEKGPIWIGPSML
jgi:hypothetical protein